MSIEEIGARLVAMCNAGQAEDAVKELYSPNIVSIEGADFAGMPARIEGLEAVVRKGEWWFANHEVHALSADGPYIGNRADQFAVKFDMDVTPTGGERMQMSEVALYTVRDDRIIEEAFLYRA